jgi:hypothetical protein
MYMALLSLVPRVEAIQRLGRQPADLVHPARTANLYAVVFG